MKYIRIFTTVFNLNEQYIYRKLQCHAPVKSVMWIQDLHWPESSLRSKYNKESCIDGEKKIGTNFSININ